MSEPAKRAEAAGRRLTQPQRRLGVLVVSSRELSRLGIYDVRKILGPADAYASSSNAIEILVRFNVQEKSWDMDPNLYLRVTPGGWLWMAVDEPQSGSP